MACIGGVRGQLGLVERQPVNVAEIHLQSFDARFGTQKPKP